jgi:uncharacterized membrane protein
MSSVPGGSYTPPPPPAAGGTSGSSDRTLMVALSYLWILALIPLLVKKDDREVQWHAKNGLVLLGAEIVAWIVLGAVGIAMRNMMGMSCGLGIIECVVWLAFLVVRIMCIVKGIGGQRFRIPLVTDWAEKWV